VVPGHPNVIMYVCVLVCAYICRYVLVWVCLYVVVCVRRRVCWCVSYSSLYFIPSAAGSGPAELGWDGNVWEYTQTTTLGLLPSEVEAWGLKKGAWVRWMGCSKLSQVQV